VSDFEGGLIVAGGLRVWQTRGDAPLHGPEACIAFSRTVR
jgi:hypothetical protein